MALLSGPGTLGPFHCPAKETEKEQFNYPGHTVPGAHCKLPRWLYFSAHVLQNMCKAHNSGGNKLSDYRDDNHLNETKK